VTDLKENKFYQFQVRAFNQAGISEASIPTVALECKEWTIAVPGKPVRIYIRHFYRHTFLFKSINPRDYNGETTDHS